jgi:hypothetical protein
VTSRSALGARETAILIATILRSDGDAATPPGAPAARRSGNTSGASPRARAIATSRPTPAAWDAQLEPITQPTLVANGHDDTMMIRENRRLLAQPLLHVQLRNYTDAGP